MPPTKKRAAKKRPGPVPKGEYSGMSAVLSTRITPDLRSWLEKASKQSGRTLSQEIENRLRQTFVDEEKLADQFGSYRTALILRVVANVLNGMPNPENLNAEWLDDAVAFDRGIDTLLWTLRAVRPKEPEDAQRLQDIKDFDAKPGSIHDWLPVWNPAMNSFKVWHEIADVSPALPLNIKLTRSQRLASIVKNKIPDVVERSKTDAAGAPWQPRPSPSPEPPPRWTAEEIEEFDKERRENYYCIYCDRFYPKDRGPECPNCNGQDLSGRKHGGDGRELEPLSQAEMNGGKQQ
jgi:hypothetical protein